MLDQLRAKPQDDQNQDNGSGREDRWGPETVDHRRAKGDAQ